jgi:hypothetical protein
MRRLPDEVFHCPTCGSEVLPIRASGGSRWRDSGEAQAFCG